MKNIAKGFVTLVGSSALMGCAGIDLGDGGLTYYDPVPYLLVSDKTDCSQSVTAVTLPGEKRSLKFKSGLGSAKLNVALANGMITSIGQETDTKIPETIAALTPLTTDKSVSRKCIEQSTLIESKTLGFPFVLPKPAPDNSPLATVSE
ncbi:hypothetical protein [Pseudomonas brassicacearum]|uniref:hypothetical protein n=1 Tax=Pseudomonas brassicacearum TaxID=930166 RepID=UPI0011D29EB1|nr:hypothetical protein [Pseudomonas brassicacearum]